MSATNDYIYYLCTHCLKVAMISKFVLLDCPACWKRLTQVDDLETMTESLESGKLQMTVWKSEEAGVANEAGNRT